MDEGFLKGLLNDVFGIFLDAGEASRNGTNPWLVTLDENFKGVSFSTFGSQDECCFFTLASHILPPRIRKVV
jgi:hypothetical protein